MGCMFLFTLHILHTDIKHFTSCVLFQKMRPMWAFSSSSLRTQKMPHFSVHTVNLQLKRGNKVIVQQYVACRHCLLYCSADLKNTYQKWKRTHFHVFLLLCSCLFIGGIDMIGHRMNPEHRHPYQLLVSTCQKELE